MYTDLIPLLCGAYRLKHAHGCGVIPQDDDQLLALMELEEAQFMEEVGTDRKNGRPIFYLTRAGETRAVALMVTQPPEVTNPEIHSPVEVDLDDLLDKSKIWTSG
jgi:hypothetical protein